MIILADSDIVRKLAYCEFLLDFLQLWDIPPNDLYVLPALKSQLKNKFLGFPEAEKNFQQFFSKVKVIPPASIVNLEILRTLDGGERQIFALMMDEVRVSNVISGDKKAWKRAGQLCFSNALLQQRFNEVSLWCFEGVILRLIEARGLSIVRARLDRWAKKFPGAIDSAVFECCRTGCDEERAKTALRRLVVNVRVESGGLKLLPLH